MEFLRRTITQIKGQLGNLTSSQRLAIALLLVLMGVAIVWMAQVSSQRLMVPLLNQPFTEDEMARIMQKLDQWQVRYEQKGDRIMVPKARQSELLTKLSWEELLPNDTSVGWSYLLEDTDIWTPESVRKSKEKIILQGELARSIEEFPGVEKAKVFINKGDERRLNNVTPVASAAVFIESAAGGSGTRRLAATIAGFVSAANNRMKRQDVKVAIDGVIVPVAAEGDELSSDYLDEKAKFEQYYRDKIFAVLPMKDALVQVDAKLQNTKTHEQTNTIAPVDEGSLVVTTDETSREETSEDIDQQQEPGYTANVSEPFNAAGTSQSHSSEDATAKRTVLPGSTTITKETPMGGIREDLTASVSIPLAYFEALGKRDTEEELTPELLKTIIDRELPGLKEAVMLAIGLAGSEYEDHVVVGTYWAGGVVPQNTGPAGPNAGNAAEASAAAGIAGMATRYGKHIAISALAMISMFMVLRMVRKAGATTDMTETEAVTLMADGKRPPSALSIEESNVPEGEDAGGLLAGLELEEGAVRSQQMLQQIRDMVQESPEAAATLVGKWVGENN